MQPQQLRKPRGVTTVIPANSITLSKCSSASNLRVKGAGNQEQRLKAARSSERSALNLNGVTLGDFKLSSHLMRKATVKTPRDVFKSKAAAVISNNQKVKMQKIHHQVTQAVRGKSKKAISSQSNDSAKTIEFEYTQDVVKVAPKKMLAAKRSLSRKASLSSSGACNIGDEGHAGNAKASEVTRTATIQTAGLGFPALAGSGSMTLTTSRSSAGLSLTGSGVQNSVGAGANPQEDRFYSTFNITQRPITITQAFNSPQPESSDEQPKRKLAEAIADEERPPSKVALRLNKIQFTLAQKMQGLDQNPVKIGKQGNETSRNRKAEPFFLPSSHQYTFAVPQKRSRLGVNNSHGAYVTARHSHKSSLIGGTNEASSLMGQTPSLQRCLKKKSKVKPSTSLNKVCSQTRLGNKTALNLRSTTSNRALSVSHKTLQKSIEQLGSQPSLKRTLQPQPKKPVKKQSTTKVSKTEKAAQPSIQLVKTTVSPSKKCRKAKEIKEAVKVLDDDKVTFKQIKSRPSEDDKPAKTKLTQIRVIRQKDSNISIEETSPRKAEEHQPVFQIAKDAASNDAAMQHRSNSQGKQSTLSYTPSNFDLSSDLPRCLRDNIFPMQKKPSIESLGKTSFSDIAKAMNREETIPDHEGELPLQTQAEQDYLEEQSHHVGSYLNMFIQNNAGKQNLLQGSTMSQSQEGEHQLLQSFLTADQKSALQRKDNRSSTFKPLQHLSDSKKLTSRERTVSGGLQSGGGTSGEDPICTLSDGGSSDGSLRQSFPQSSSKLYDHTLKSLPSDTRYSIFMPPQTTDTKRFGLTSITPDQPSLQDLHSPSTGESYLMRKKKMLDQLQMQQYQTVEEETKITDFNLNNAEQEEPLLEVQVLHTDEEFAQLQEINLNNWETNIPRVIAVSDSSENSDDY